MAARIVLKLGGRVAEQTAAEALVLQRQGYDVVVVHGAGPQITAEMERRGITPSFVDGRRVTTAEVLQVVRESLLAVNAAVCATIGEAAIGLLGDEIGLPAEQVPELGLVGTPLPSAPPRVLEALALGRIPVIVPLAEGPLNVNADEAAAALAVGLGAERIRFVSDVAGVYVADEVVPEIDVSLAGRMLADGSFQGGIVPKLEAALHAVRGGVHASIGTTEVVA